MLCGLNQKSGYTSGKCCAWHIVSAQQRLGCLWEPGAVVGVGMSLNGSFFSGCKDLGIVPQVGREAGQDVPANLTGLMSEGCEQELFSLGTIWTLKQAHLQAEICLCLPE